MAAVRLLQRLRLRLRLLVMLLVMLLLRRRLQRELRVLVRRLECQRGGGRSRATLMVAWVVTLVVQVLAALGWRLGRRLAVARPLGLCKR